MYDSSYRGRGAASAEVYENDRPVFESPIDTEEIFRRLIVDELRGGRLTPMRRRRIVQYAAQMGLSARQAGRLIETCRGQALHSTDPTERRRAFRLVEPEPTHIPTRFKIAFVVAAAIVLDVLIIYLLR